MPNHLFDAIFGAKRTSEAPFLVFADGQTLSYRGFLDLAARLANAFVELGVKPGDRIALQAEKSPVNFAAYVAAVEAGGVFLPLNTAYTAAEVDYFVSDAEPRIVICDPANAEKLAPIAEKAGATLLTLDADGKGTLADAAQGQPSEFAPVAREEADLAAILYTSGTTGRSKGAMLSHGNLASNALVLKDYWRFTEADRLVHALPIYHTHGLFTAGNVLASAGGSMIFLPRFDLDQVMAALPGATAMMGVPTFYTRLLTRPDFTRELVSHMRLFVSGSAPLLASTHEEFSARTGHRILERYGMTETSMNTSNPYDGERRPGTVGHALPGSTVRVVDPETREQLPAGDIGMVEVKGPNVFSGYWRMPEKTAEELHEDGFFTTGDLGEMSADGYLTIVGRGKDLVISGGLNIYPKEIEEVIDAIAGVRESAVFGVAHADLGEAAVAAVVRDGSQALTEDEVLSALADRLARFKHPRKVVFVEELPRNTMGKVQKAALRERYADVLKG